VIGGGTGLFRYRREDGGSHFVHSQIFAQLDPAFRRDTMYIDMYMRCLRG